MLELFQNIPEDQAHAYGLVLSSSGIQYQVKKSQHGSNVWVDDKDYEKAQSAIEKYIEENNSIHRKDERVFYEYQKTFTGIYAAVILLVCHVAIQTGNDLQIFIEAYGSSASHILQGEWYRSVTSLIIHANALHLSGNMVGIVIFGTAVCTAIGWGPAWLMILATGISGNLVNAVLYRASHISVGASTAVFGAIGILSAYQFVKKFKLPRQRIKAWLPLGGGLALLGVLGSGEYVDLTAHLFGFLAGIILGSLYTVFVKRPVTLQYQVSCILITFCILVMSWVKGLP